MEIVLSALVTVLEPANLFICIFALFVGVLFGALPGFSATMGVAVFVPFSYVLEPQQALLLLTGVYCGGVYGGSISAILLGIPGTPASVPTAYDGKQLTAKGESGRALLVATIASCFGGFASAVALTLFSPLLARIAMMVGPPEQVMIAIFGLSVVCMLAFGNMLKGILVGFLALLIATVGQDPVLGYPRFTGGLYQLISGFSVVPVLIGVFSLPEVFKMLEKPKETLVDIEHVSKMKIKLKDITGNMVNLIRSSLLGIGIGIIPAAGPDIAAFLSYNEAKKASKHPEEFGKGSIEGLIAAETANNGVTGGSLIPLLTLGIPGSAPAAIFLGAMIIHGLRPGPMLFTANADTVYTLLIGFGIINILMLFVGLFYCKVSQKILVVPKSVLAITIAVLAVIGSYSINQNVFDVIVMFVFGVIGYIMLKFDYPLSPIALALLLGPMLEESLTLVNTMYDGNYFKMLSRPLTLLFFIITLASFFYPFISKYIKKKA